MNFKKIFTLVRLNLKGSAPKRADFLRELGVFDYMGKNVSYSLRTIPLYPNLIRIHDNVRLASGVKFITHDISDNVINHYLSTLGRKEKVTEKIGCIEICDNVFVGADTLILYDVKIGENCIIGAGSLVTKDIPPNSVAVGRPCRVIGSFSDYVEKRMKEEKAKDTSLEKPVRGVRVPAKTASAFWRSFDKKRK